MAVCRQPVKKNPIKERKGFFTAEGCIHRLGRPQRSKAPQLKKRKPQALLRRPMSMFYSNEAFRVLEVPAPTPFSLRNFMNNKCDDAPDLVVDVAGKMNGWIGGIRSPQSNFLFFDVKPFDGEFAIDNGDDNFA